MTLIGQQSVTNKKTPGLHALLIGVAEYPHLQGARNDAKKHFGLRQITSPKPTILAITDWLQQHYQNPAKPLASIELLLSSPTASGSVERATMAGIAEAFQRWVGRCSENDTAFFYFCGHGLNKNTQLILPEDFGNPKYDIWKNAIDFDATQSGMRGCPAKTQLFFVDACASMPPALLDEDPRGERLMSAPFRIKAPISGAYKAAAYGHAAFAPPNGLSFFSQAVLKCMEGAGASQQDDGSWAVGSTGLAKHLNDVVKRIARKEKIDLQCTQSTSGDDEVIHRVKQPIVLTWLECRRLQHSQMSMHSGAHPAKPARSDNPPWLDEVPPGIWKFTVTFRTSSPYTWEHVLSPSCYYHTIPA